MRRILSLPFVASLLALVGCGPTNYAHLLAPAPSADVKVLLSGNSIPAGIFGLPFQGLLADTLRKVGQGKTFDVSTNVAVSGQFTTDMLRNDAALLSPAYDPARPTVLVAWEGTNDLCKLALDKAPNPGQQAFEHLKQYFLDRKAQFPGLRTVTGTILPRTNAPNPEVFEPARLLTNQLLRQAILNREPWLDALADPADTPAFLKNLPLADGKESKLYHDWVHPNKAGLQVLTPLFAQAVLRAAAK